MSEQQHLFEPEPSTEPQQRPSAAVAGRPRSRTEVWLARTELLVRVVVRLYLGLVLLALPWTHLWTENGLWSYAGALAWMAGNGFVRGVVSGLGLLNVGIALADLFGSES